MIFTPRIVALVGLLLFVSVVVQLSFFSQMTFLGAIPNIVPAVIVALGLLSGAVPGVTAGFFAGLLLDSALGTTLGVASLSLMAAGYLAGRWRETYDIASALVPPLLAGVLTGVAATTYAAFQLTLGVEAPVSLLVLREIFLQSVIATFLAVPIFSLIRRVLRPALVDDARPGRRGSRPVLRMS